MTMSLQITRLSHLLLLFYCFIFPALTDGIYKDSIKLEYCRNIFSFLPNRPQIIMSVSETPNEFKLSNMHNDGISAVKFGPHSKQFLLVSSWDETVRLYDVVADTQRFKYTHSAPVLDCCFYVSKVFKKSYCVINLQDWQDFL